MRLACKGLPSTLQSGNKQSNRKRKMSRRDKAFVFAFGGGSSGRVFWLKVYETAALPLSYTGTKAKFQFLLNVMSTLGVKLALFFPDMPFLPMGNTSSSSDIASLCIPSITWLYTSIVKATELCPRASEITFGLAPRSNIRLAKVCLRSWKRTLCKPALFTILAKLWLSTPGGLSSSWLRWQCPGTYL